MSGGQKQSQETAPAQPARRRPERPSLSCTECRRRKQKCNQGKPCTNCSRRFPQPICEYDTRVSKRSKRPGAQTSEDPTLGVTDNNGPYSHLKNAGVQDAILQIELPTRVMQRGSGELLSPSSSSWSSGSDIHEQDSRDPWIPFTQRVGSQHTSIRSKTIYQAIRKIVQDRSVSTMSFGTGDWKQGAAVVLQAVHDSLPPSKPVGSYFDDLRHLPMAPTRLNKELVRTHLQLLCRFKVSIDGHPGSDNAFMRHWIPFTIQDPLMLHVVLYTSACFLRETGHVPKTLTMAYKGNVYQMLNNSLRSEKTQCNDVTVLAVAQLVIDEWYWGATNDLHAHMLGLKRIVHMRGGMQKLGMHGFLAKLVLLHDIGMSLAHETEPMMFDRPGFEFDDPIMVPFQTSLNSPFVSGWPTFASSSLARRLHPSTAAILDDMRILIETVLSGLDENFEHTDPNKLAATVSWVRHRLDSLPQEINELPDRPSRESSIERGYSSSPAVDSAASSHSSPAESLPAEPDPVYSWVRRTAIIYCRAITYRQSLSTACLDSDFDYLWHFTIRIQSNAAWTTVGVLFWVITAITPAALDGVASRFLKTIIIGCLMNMGVDNWHVAIDAARRALKLQAWLRGGGDRAGKISGGEKGIETFGFALKEELPSFGLTAHYEDGEDDGG